MRGREQRLPSVLQGKHKRALGGQGTLAGARLDWSLLRPHTGLVAGSAPQKAAAVSATGVGDGEKGQVASYGKQPRRR